MRGAPRSKRLRKRRQRRRQRRTHGEWKIECPLARGAGVRYGNLSKRAVIQGSMPDNNDTVSLPPGFERPLVLLLAMEMCLPFSRPIPDGLPQLTQAAKLTIQALAAEILGTPMPGAPAQPPQPGQGKQ